MRNWGFDHSRSSLTLGKWYIDKAITQSGLSLRVLFVRHCPIPGLPIPTVLDYNYSVPKTIAASHIITKNHQTSYPKVGFSFTLGGTG
ncbi:MAG: hypothetical protein F6J90_21855 [Moorea sp. SIOASIH]|uniref:hypothetical protein n=1 Tax=Moorena sp. SIOASIH TaxID=2607817 RepID=UPI0013B5DE76|nr:hypothetical protein [Moorena sp. SIOASIH]NEO38836.1 hypothetical protein [Moorena sp. SIOASIH]